MKIQVEVLFTQDENGCLQRINPIRPPPFHPSDLPSNLTLWQNIYTPLDIRSTL
ncbi:MAG: hypothetical protein OXH39_18145 [Candidatus Poribacteria bacterium]|nr:hypothetical protein [Candidatus Poribacteria bacterium]